MGYDLDILQGIDPVLANAQAPVPADLINADIAAAQGQIVGPPPESAPNPLDAFEAFNEVNEYEPIAAPVPAPVQAPVQTAPVQVPANQGIQGIQGTSVGHSESSSGLDEQRFGRLQAGKGFQGRVNAHKNTRYDEAAGQNAILDDAYGSGMDALGAEARTKLDVAQTARGDADAVRDQVEATALQLGLAAPRTTGAAQQAAAQASVAAKEFELAQKAQARADIARANLEEQLNRVKAMRINPTQLFESNPLSFALQNGSAMLMAASGKPGMMQAGQMLQNGILQAVNRDIDGQLRNLENGQKVAAGFKQIYDMVSQENDTAAARRDKVYAAYLASIESFMESEAGKHDSAIVQADYLKNLAALKEKRAEAQVKNYQHAQDLALKDANIELGKYQSDISASNVRAQIADNRAERKFRADLENAKAKGATKEFVQKNAIPNPFDPNKTVVGFGRTDKEGEEMRNMSSNTALAIKEVEKLNELAKRLNAEKSIMNAAGVNALKSEYALQADVVRNVLGPVIAKQLDPSGKISDKDQERVNQMIPVEPTGLWLSSPESAYGQVQRVLKERWDEEMGTKAVDINVLGEDVRAEIWNGYTGEGGSAGKAFEDVAGAHIAAGKNPDSPVKQDYKDVIGVSKRDSDLVGQGDVPEWYRQYAASVEGQNYGDKSSKVQGYNFKRAPGSMSPSLVEDELYRMPDWAEDMRSLAREAYRGDPEAKSRLADIAALEGSEWQEQSDMARYFLSQPAGLGTSVMLRNK